MQKIFQNSTVIFYIFLGVSLVITRLPWIGKYFRGLNTLIHETGHSVMALILSGNVHRIDLSSDTSGSVITSTDSVFKRFLVTIAGYPFSSVAALIFFYFLEQKAYQYVVYPLIGLAVFNLILFVRNIYGIFWLLSFTVISAAVIFFDNDMLWFAFSLLLAFIVLTESFISTINLIIISLKTPKLAGDAKNLNEITHLPVMFWSLLFMGFSGYISYKTIFLYFPAIF